MKTIAASCFAKAWYDLLCAIWEEGHEARPRGTCIRELLAVTLHVPNMLNNILVHPVRNLNYRFMVAEWLWIMAGRADVESIAKYNSNIAKFSDGGTVFHGAYGPRLGAQLKQFLQVLNQDQDSRQAVMNIYHGPRDLGCGSKDIPCTLSLQVFIRNNVLHGIVNMRSSDIWLGLPYDFFNFSMICNALCLKLGAEPGSLTFNLGSSHLYSENAFKADQVIRSESSLESLHSPRLTSWPNGIGDEVHLDDAAELVLTGPEGAGSIWSYYQQALELPRNSALSPLRRLASLYA